MFVLQQFLFVLLWYKVRFRGINLFMTLKMNFDQTYQWYSFLKEKQLIIFFIFIPSLLKMPPVVTYHQI